MIQAEYETDTKPISLDVAFRQFLPEKFEAVILELQKFEITVLCGKLETVMRVMKG